MTSNQQSFSRIFSLFDVVQDQYFLFKENIFSILRAGKPNWRTLRTHPTTIKWLSGRFDGSVARQQPQHEDLHDSRRPQRTGRGRGPPPAGRQQHRLLRMRTVRVSFNNWPCVQVNSLMLFMLIRMPIKVVLRFETNFLGRNFYSLFSVLWV